MKILLLLSLLIAGLTNAQAQEKRISKKQMPAGIIAYLETRYPSVKNFRYYTEVQNDTVFYEADFHYHHTNYSIEFYADGTLYEFEEEVPFHSLPAETRMRMEEAMKSKFKKFKVTRTERINAHANLLYEIEAKGKTRSGWHFFELFFDKEGNLLKNNKIVLESIQATF